MEEWKEKSGLGKSVTTAVEEEEKEDVVLPGFRFHPTDEELVGFYLRRKVEKEGFSIEIIKEMDIYKHDPWVLPKVISAGEKEWYFFCLRGRKYRNSIRPNRVTGSGFWKATGIDRPIYSATDTSNCIGLKKSLVYYRGSAGKGTKTNWMMHEFRLPCKNTTDINTSPSMQEAEVWTICRIFQRTVSYKKSSVNNWKTTPADSSSKTSSSFEYDSGKDHKLFASSSSSSLYPQEEMNYHSYYYAENNDQMYARQWNSIAQAPIATLLHSEVVPSSTNVDDLVSDGNWDELGRIVEFMADDKRVSFCGYH